MLHLAAETGKDYYVELARQIPGQLCYFIMGVGLYRYLDFFERHVTAFLLVAVLLLVADRLLSLGFLEPAALGVIVIFSALFMFLGNFGRYGDFSYGVYIVHFPIIQLYLYSGVLAEQPLRLLAMIVVTAGVGGILMWHLCEKRFLRRESHYRVVANSA
jgi:peptidoglycan/LPS O-acetylase OafA/YrhL